MINSHDAGNKEIESLELERIPSKERHDLKLILALQAESDKSELLHSMGKCVI